MFGQMDRVGRRSLGVKSTLPFTEVLVYLRPLLDVNVGRVREPLVQKKEEVFLKGERIGFSLKEKKNSIGPGVRVR